MAEIIDLNIYPTIETVDVTIETIIDNVVVTVQPTTDDVNINITPNLITINVNKIIGGGAVQSVNGQTGDVVLNIPTSTSDLINDGEDGINPFITLQDIPPIDVSTLVPYNNATQNVNLGEFELKAGQLTLDTTPTGTAGVGVMRWNDADGTLDLGLKGGNVTLQIGQEEVVRVVNKTATNVNLLQANYQAVRITGAQGQRLKVDLAQATNDALSSETIGLVTETINNNQEGFITTNGLVRGINTTGSLQGETWVDGDIVYLSATTAGNITNIKPTAPNHLVIIGYVVSAHITQGSIFVKVDVGYELEELHNVAISSVANNQILTYESATQLWKNKNLNQIVSERRNANNSSNNNINYCGTAPNGSAESSAVWTIKRLTIAASGSITIATATNVAWTNRQSATYI